VRTENLPILRGWILSSAVLRGVSGVAFLLSRGEKLAPFFDYKTERQMRMQWRESILV
jgi:hypothetical protein